MSLYCACSPALMPDPGFRSSSNMQHSMTVRGTIGATNAEMKRTIAPSLVKWIFDSEKVQEKYMKKWKTWKDERHIHFLAPWFAELQICIANWRHPLRKRLITARLERKEPPKKLMQSQPLHFLPCVPEWCLCLDLCHHSQSWWPERPRRATADLVAPQNWSTWTNPTSTNIYRIQLNSIISWSPSRLFRKCCMMLYE